MNAAKEMCEICCDKFLKTVLPEDGQIAQFYLKISKEFGVTLGPEILVANTEIFMKLDVEIYTI